MRTVTLSAPDISCASCVAHIRAALADLPAVAGASVDLGQRRVRIELRDDADLADVQARLADDGYPTTVVAG